MKKKYYYVAAILVFSLLACACLGYKEYQKAKSEEVKVTKEVSSKIAPIPIRKQKRNLAGPEKAIGRRQICPTINYLYLNDQNSA